MSKKLSKFGPLAAVAGTLGYLCWPYFDDPTAAIKSKAAAKSAEPLASLLAVKAAADVRPDLFEVPKGLTRPAARIATGGAGGKSGSAKKGASSTGTMEALVLNGTYVAADARYAVINGSLYSEGDQIVLAKSGKPGGNLGAEPPEACTLKHVDVDKVVLSFQGKSKELHYANPPSPAETEGQQGGLPARQSSVGSTSATSPFAGAGGVDNRSPLPNHQ